MAEKKFHSDSPKCDALKRLLARYGRDTDEELIRQIEALYRNDAQEDSKSESAPEPEFPKDSFAVYRFKGNGNDFYFTSSEILTLYSSALIYLEAGQHGDIDRLSLDSLAYRYYGESGTVRINDVLFSVLAQALPNDDRMTAVIEYDFDEFCVRVYGKEHSAVTEYDLGDLADTALRTEATHPGSATEGQRRMEGFLNDNLFPEPEYPDEGIGEISL